MNQNQQQLPFKTFQLLQLQCQKTKKFLSGNVRQESKLIGKSKSTLSLQMNANDDSINFIVELQDETENEFLCYGDLIAIKHFKSQLYVNTSNDNKHDELKEFEVYLNEEPEYFVIQPPEEENFSLLKYVNQHITHPFRLLSSDNRNYLISQQKNDNVFYSIGRQKLISKNQQEGIWNFVQSKSTNDNLKIFDRVHSAPIFIETRRKIIIRNWWTGFTLHSHTFYSQQRKTQEVTCYSHPRDDNDYWSIVKQNSRNTSKFISYDDQIFLQHIETGKYLNGSDQDSFSKLGKLVLCSDNAALLNTQAFDDFILEVNKPFTIKFNNYFLAQSSSRAESNTGIQQECIYVKKQSQECLWIIEKMI
ncbi:unnamed protein product (macronuclear) [Paramecium tetraurelia]|uniref:MIR domain-containing protein n=1 Tax=Paramecium tetraurelia TaxID=5888 RepID=A0E1I7_PARTE|nr:uncharacterized protein GSPATT00022323001 [Paramecium tetraurelia]CAK89154.1 unnamed protein product [Paramecium tetraurelia]|eukprot:XP_001456551.1 hypothetical protein (macronuclear) [Paramecium tetraurelia strain d4-2]